MAVPPDMKATAMDFTKYFADLKLPGMPSMEALVQANRRNFEALTAANRVALEGAQMIARRHAEIMQHAMGELTEAMQAVTSTESPQEKAVKQAEVLKRGYERAVGDLQELSDLIQKSNAEAISVLNRRFAEAMDEVKALADKSVAP